MQKQSASSNFTAIQMLVLLCQAASWVSAWLKTRKPFSSAEMKCGAFSVTIYRHAPCDGKGSAHLYIYWNKFWSNTILENFWITFLFNICLFWPKETNYEIVCTGWRVFRRFLEQKLEQSQSSALGARYGC